MEQAASFRGRFGGLRLVWQTYYSSYCLGLLDYIPAALVLALDEGADTRAITRSSGVLFCSREQFSPRREKFSERALEELAPRFEQAIRANLNGRWRLWSVVPAEALAPFCLRAGAACQTISWEHSLRFGSKVQLHRALAQLELPRLPGLWVNPACETYASLSAKLGARFVLQAEHGADGSGTSIVADGSQFAAAAARLQGTAVWAAPFAGPLSLNINAFAAPGVSLASFPSVQLAGVPGLRNGDAGHCGNDFTAACDLPRGLVANVGEPPVRIGGWLAASGYRGLFGLDFVLDERTGAACIVDLNPRWQGSTSLEAQAARRQGRIPLAAAAAAYEAGVLTGAELAALEGSLGEPLAGAQFFHRAPAHGAWTVRHEAAPGVYTGSAGFLRPALELAELTGPDGVLLNGHNPRRGARIGPGARLLRVCSLRRMANPATGQLETWACLLAGRLDGLLGLEAAED